MKLKKLLFFSILLINSANLIAQQSCKVFETYNQDVLKQYFEKNHDLKCKNQYGAITTPLLHAAEEGNFINVAKFAKAGANPNIQAPTNGFTPLIYVIHHLSSGDEVNTEDGFKALTELLKNPDINVNKTSKNNNETALFWAAARMERVTTDKDLFFKIIKLLVQLGADITIKNNQGQTAIDAAPPHVKAYLQEQLKKQGKDYVPAKPDTSIQRCQNLAQYSVDDLKKHYKDIIDKPCLDKFGAKNPPLLHAAEEGNFMNVAKFAKAGANPNIQAPTNGFTPLIYVIHHLSSGDEVNTEDGFKALTELLKNPDINVNKTSKNNNETALFWAAARMERVTTDKDLFFKIIKLLVQHGADITIKNNQGQTAIDVAPPHVKAYLQEQLKNK